MLCLRYIAQNPIGLPIVWEFIREEWPYLVERFSLNDRYLGRMPKYISYTFSSQLRLDELLAFFKKYPEAGAGKFILNYVRFLSPHFYMLTVLLIYSKAISVLKRLFFFVNNLKKLLSNWFIQFHESELNNHGILKLRQLQFIAEN